jgi:hypothetical protein
MKNKRKRNVNITVFATKSLCLQFSTTREGPFAPNAFILERKKRFQRLKKAYLCTCIQSRNFYPVAERNLTLDELFSQNMILINQKHNALKVSRLC